MERKPWLHTLAIIFFATVFCLTVYNLVFPFAVLVGLTALAALLGACECKATPDEVWHPDWYKSEEALR